MASGDGSQDFGRQPGDQVPEQGRLLDFNTKAAPAETAAERF
jgi:hypothetical protein